MEPRRSNARRFPPYTRRTGRLPEGQSFHAGGPTSDGWQIVAIHDSKESWETFRDNVLMPRLSAGVDGGFSGPPQETAFEVVAMESTAPTAVV